MRVVVRRPAFSISNIGSECRTQDFQSWNVAVAVSLIRCIRRKIIAMVKQSKTEDKHSNWWLEEIYRESLFGGAVALLVGFMFWQYHALNRLPLVGFGIALAILCKSLHVILFKKYAHRIVAYRKESLVGSILAVAVLRLFYYLLWVAILSRFIPVVAIMLMSLLVVQATYLMTEKPWKK